MHVLMITTDWPSSFMTRQVEFLRRAGAQIDVFYFQGAKNPVNYLRAWQHVHKTLAHERYDLVHAQFGQSAFPALPKRLPLVVTFRGSDVQGIVGPAGNYLWYGYFLNWFSYLVALLANQTVVVSEVMTGKLPRRKYHVIPSGLDLQLFQPMDRLEARRLLSWSQEEKVVLFGGNPSVPEKRYSLACEAMDRLRVEFPEVRMVALQNIEHTKVPTYLNACNVLLLVSTHEGSPNVIKEALACNVPVVSTDVGDVRRRIGDVSGCMLCEDDRPETISSALALVLKQDTRIDGRLAVLELDENLLAQKMLSVYELAVKES